MQVASASAVPRRRVTLDVLSSVESRESFVREARKRAPADVVASMADVLAHHAEIISAKLAAGQDQKIAAVWCCSSADDLAA